MNPFIVVFSANLNAYVYHNMLLWIPLFSFD